MSNKSEQDRERLKEEYKEHYRRIKEAKERLRRAEQKGKISQAVKNMNADDLLESVDEFLGKVKDKVTHVEARLEVAMDNLSDDQSEAAQKIKEEELDQELKRQKAKQTLKQVKAEMGMLYNEIERHADELNTKKTIGSSKKQDESESDNSSEEK